MCVGCRAGGAMFGVGVVRVSFFIDQCECLKLSDPLALCVLALGCRPSGVCLQSGNIEVCGGMFCLTPSV